MKLVSLGLSPVATRRVIGYAKEFNLINEEQSFFVSEPVINNESDNILDNLNTIKLIHIY